MVKYNFDDDFYILLVCSIMFMLPAEFDKIFEVFENDKDVPDDVANQKPLCYYVMDNGVVEERTTMFEKPYLGMTYHLKPLFIREKFDGTPVIKVFIEKGATMSLMSHSLLKNIGKSDVDLREHNMVLSNYVGKISHIM